MPVPQNCTASQFTVTVYGAANTSTAGFGLYLASSLNPSGLGGALGCTITANNGGTATCNSTGIYALTTSDFVVIATYNTETPADFANAQVYTSFVCK